MFIMAVLSGLRISELLSLRVSDVLRNDHDVDRVHVALGNDVFKTQKALGHASITSALSYLSFNEREINEAVLNDRI